MLLMSRHLTEFNIVPAGAVIRINLAWEPSIQRLRGHLDELTAHVFLDVPFGRKKPPVNNYDIDEIVSIVEEFENVRYLGISQVERSEQLKIWKARTPTRVNIVPKIESMRGINNIKKICSILRTPKIIMLDHDDLFQDLCNGKCLRVDPARMYEDWINPLIVECHKMGVRVLRTAGVVFISEGVHKE